MNTWAPLWSGIVDSSLFEEPGDVVKVFIAICATKDSDHICRLDTYRLAKKCHLDELRTLEILKLLASPDQRRQIPQEFGGRRIRAVEDGWFVLNGEKYRNMVSDEMRKAKNRRGQAAFRARQKVKRWAQANGSPIAAPGEAAYLRAENSGATQEQLDAVVSESILRD
jgi:hypothetical protein